MWKKLQKSAKILIGTHLEEVERRPKDTLRSPLLLLLRRKDGEL